MSNPPPPPHTHNPLKVNNIGSTTLATYTASKQPPPFGYSSPQLQQFGSFHSSNYSGLPATFPVNLQLNPPANNSRVSSGSSVIDQSLQHDHPLNKSPHDSMRKSPNTPHSFHNPTQTRSSTSSTPTSPQTHMPANIPGRFHFPSISSPFTLPSSLPSTSFSSLTSMQKSHTGTNINSPTTCISTPTTSSSPSLTTQPGVTASNVTALTSSSYQVQDVNSLEYRKLILETVQQWGEHKQKMMKGRAKRLRLKSPPMFRDGSVQSPTSGDAANPGQPSSSVNLGPSLNTMIVIGSTDTPGFNSHFQVFANTSREGSSTSTILDLGSPKLLTAGPSEILADNLAPHSITKIDSAPSSLELTCTSPSTTTMSIPPMFRDGSIQSPTSDDTANPGQPSSSTDTPGFNSLFQATVSSANTSREGSSTSTILGLSSPKLLTVGPPDTFDDTLAPHPSSNAPSSLDLTSPSSTTMSIPPMFRDGSVRSPTSDDTANPGQPSSSVNLGPSLNTVLVSSSTDTPGFNSHFKVTVSSANISREGSSTSTILGLGSPELLPDTFADTKSIAPCPSSNSPSSLELTSPSTTTMSATTPSLDLTLPSTTCTSITSPIVVPSVVSSAARMDDILTASYGCSMVAPSVVLDSSFMGDISSMSRSELEQLCKHNMEKLELQKKIISILEAQLKQVREQLESFSTQKPTQSDIYQRFLPFVVEPKLIPDFPDKFGYGHFMKQLNGASTKPTPDFNEVIKGGTFDRPVLNEKYDFYANFGHSQY